MSFSCQLDRFFCIVSFQSMPNQKFSWEHSGIKVGNVCNLLIIVGSWLAYVAFIEGSFPQCGPQYIAVFGGTIPLLVRIMWALPMRYQGHFPQYTQDIIMEFLLKIHYYLPTLYSLIICLPYIHLYLLTLIPTPLLLAYLNRL